MSEKVNEMFTRVAPRYDTVNTVLSFGTHHGWRKKTVRLSKAKAGDKVLDCASGTGDLAFAFAEVVGANGHVTATDFNEAMLSYGPQKAARRNLPCPIDWQVQDVTQLSFEDNAFDLASISFGIRNVTDPVKGLSEMARVVRPGGSVIVLEFGRPPAGLFHELYGFYSRHILPRLGGLLSGQPADYRYLHETSSEFPCGDDFIDMMNQTGQFFAVEHTTFTGGITHFYRGIVA